MKHLLLRLPFVVILAFVAAFSMFIPAVHARLIDDDRTARVFFYFALLSLFLVRYFRGAKGDYEPTSDHSARSTRFGVICHAAAPGGFERFAKFLDEYFVLERFGRVVR